MATAVAAPAAKATETTENIKELIPKTESPVKTALADAPAVTTAAETSENKKPAEAEKKSEKIDDK